MAGTMGLLLIQNRRRYTKPKVKNDIRHFWYIIKSTYVTKKHRQKLFVNTFVCVCVCRHVCCHSFACVSSFVLPFLRMCVVIPSHVSVMCVSSCVCRHSFACERHVCVVYGCRHSCSRNASLCSSACFLLAMASCSNTSLMSTKRGRCGAGSMGICVSEGAKNPCSCSCSCSGFGSADVFVLVLVVDVVVVVLLLLVFVSRFLFLVVSSSCFDFGCSRSFSCPRFCFCSSWLLGVLFVGTSFCVRFIIESISGSSSVLVCAGGSSLFCGPLAGSSTG